MFCECRMCSVIKPLPNNLKFKYEKRNISIYDRTKNIVIKSDIISKRTGSRSFVYKIICNGSNGFFPVVAKVQKSKGERLAGLQYEKMIYALMTKIVESGVCPFRLRSYNMSEPSNILITETFNNMIDLGAFLDTFQDDNKYHVDDCYNILTQIFYAIEVNFRVGIRHNDLHLHNVMIQFCPQRDTKNLIYLNRSKDMKKTITMNNCSFFVKLFDNDRVTKLGAKNKNVNSIYKTNYDPKPVLDLFPWHESAVYTEKLDMFKIMQHIRDDSLSPFLDNLLASLNVSFSKAEKKKKSMLHGQKNFMTYLLVTDRKVRREPLAPRCSVTKTSDDACTMGNLGGTKPTFPNWLNQLNSPEQALMTLAAYAQAKSKKNNSVVVGDMSKLYVKTKL